MQYAFYWSARNLEKPPYARPASSQGAHQHEVMSDSRHHNRLHAILRSRLLRCRQICYDIGHACTPYRLALHAYQDMFSAEAICSHLSTTRGKYAAILYEVRQRVAVKVKVYLS